MDSFIIPLRRLRILFMALTLCTSLGIGITPAPGIPPDASPRHTTKAKAAVIPSHNNPTNAISEFLLAHNKARKAVGVAPLQWGKKIANETSLLVRYQRDKKACFFAVSGLAKYNMNQFRTRNIAVTPRAVVESWVKEKKYYNHANKTCAENHYCNTYEQVIWKNTVWVGCAQARCLKENLSLTICMYNPP